MNMECFPHSLNTIEAWCVKILLKTVGYTEMIGNSYDTKYIFVHVFYESFFRVSRVKRVVELIYDSKDSNEKITSGAPQLSSFLKLPSLNSCSYKFL